MSLVRRRALGALHALAFPALLVLGCSSSGGQNGQATLDAGGDASEAGDDGGFVGPCTPPTPSTELVRFMPNELVLAPGESKQVKVYIEPDVCESTPIPVLSDTPSVATVTANAVMNRNQAEAMVTVTAVANGSAKITSTWGPSTATLQLTVQDKTPIACPSPGTPETGMVGPGSAFTSSIGAQISVAAGATGHAPGNYDKVDPFVAQIGCADVAPPSGMIALGPAITFGPYETRWLRDVDFEIPINPALMPQTAKLRHLQVLYSSPSLKTPRMVPVANPDIMKTDKGFVLHFESSRLGTYQVVVPADAGTKTYTRTINHRAVFGFSMGGIGSSMFGMNHHDMFDVVAPLGGPLDANFFLWYFANYHFGGFCPHAAGDPVPSMPCYRDVGAPTEINEHVQDFEHWWHMNGVGGTGGTFARSAYVDIFRDVCAAWGDPIGQNSMFDYVAPGVNPPTSFAVTSGADYCTDPKKALVAATGFYDAKYNPDGSLPVIRFCDGNNDPANAGWFAPGGNRPLEVALAVDYNKNGVRDAGEPVITQGFEPFKDFGVDGVDDVHEDGYDPIKLPDPNGDDYDPQFNPLGTEGNHHWDGPSAGMPGEHFDDVGLDGVPCPSGKTCPFDYGEGDGKYTMSSGLTNFINRDGRSQLLGWAPAPVGGAWDDKATHQLDYFSDGGIRDLFNWGRVGDHYLGGFTARKLQTMVFNDWTHLPNARTSDSDNWDPKNVDWDALGKYSYLRYGNIDASDRLIADGDGQHVGYADQLFRRIQSGLFYIGSRWPDADRSYVESVPDGDDPTPCAQTLTCEIQFTAAGHTGPNDIILPPGYHNPENAGKRYPVVYFLHGYGMEPSGLGALTVLITPLMQSGLSSEATRLPKFIMVIVDGHCRGTGDATECVTGDFYTNSPRAGGAEIDDYFLALTKKIETDYRTMGPQTFTFTE